jgi:excisionase family DNA binding protein
MKAANTIAHERLLLTGELAEVLRKHPETIRRALREARLRGIKVGNSWRIEDSELVCITKEGGL